MGALAPVPPGDATPHKPQLVEAKPPRRRANVGAVVGVLLLIGAAVAAWWSIRPSRPAPKTAGAIRTATVRLASVEKTMRLNGVTVAGRFSLMLAPQMRGSRFSRGTTDFQQILQSVAPSGARVRKGDVVAEFDRMYMMMRLDDYKAAVIQQQANLRSLNALLDMRRKNYAQQTIRYRGARDKAALDIKKNPVLSAIKAENNQLNLQQYHDQLKEVIAEEKFFETSEKASIRRSEIDLRVSEMELSRAERNAEAMVVHAPFDGLVVMQTIRRGTDTSEIGAGDKLAPGQPYMQIVDPTSIAVDASVNQVDIDQLRVGASARVSFDAFPGLEVPARVVSVGAMANSRGWRPTYVKDVAVRLSLQAMDPRIIPNFSVAADVVLDEAHDVPTIPRESVFADPEDGSTIAFVRSPQGWEKREVQIGLVNAVTAQVKSGLNPGDVVASEWPMDQPAGPR
jgi:HlyD family secretion protein